MELSQIAGVALLSLISVGLLVGIVAATARADEGVRKGICLTAGIWGASLLVFSLIYVALRLIKGS